MAELTYDKQLTALLVIDSYNDFIAEGGKVWDRLKAVAEANQCVPHMVQVLHAARQAGLRVFYALHCRYRPGDYETWTYIAPIQEAAWLRKTFEHGTWGGEIRRAFAPQQATSWPSSIGVPVALPTPIWMCSSSSTASISSSSSDSWPTCVWSPPYAVPLSLATRSRWPETRPRATRRRDAHRTRHQYPKRRQGHGDHTGSR